MLPSENQLEQAIKDLKEPVKFQGFQKNIPGENNPEFLRWGPEKFIEILDDEVLPFRIGYNARTLVNKLRWFSAQQPQWDVQCPTEKMTLQEFIMTTEAIDDSKWRYFDYKYMNQWFEEDRDFLKSIDWKRFGVDKNGYDSTLWIGSKGAHTNCHQDSYGCNLIAQLHGRKLWLLFPPDTGNSIKPTRVPYEESTIYSRLNFFCPTVSNEEAIMRIERNARLIVLEPGDVLLVPNGWWHYVESLDFSISINVWLPIVEDHKERIKEALVKLLVSNIGPELPSSNEPEYTRSGGIELIEACINEYKRQSELISQSSSMEKKFKRAPWTAQELAKDYPNSVILVPELSREKLRELVTGNRERFPEIELPFRETETVTSATIEIVNALCNSEIISKVSDLLIDN